MPGIKGRSGGARKGAGRPRGHAAIFRIKADMAKFTLSKSNICKLLEVYLKSFEVIAKAEDKE